MGDIYRIIERFKITARGTVYTVNAGKSAVIRMGDVLYDLRGSRFKVKGIETICKISSGKYKEDTPVGLLFELIDGSEVSGNIMVRELQNINFLFCNHPLYQNQVDEDYREEYHAASLKHPCALFSYEDLERKKLSLYGKSISGFTIYRGWMMKPEIYAVFYSLLESNGIILMNTPEEYERYHTLPGWYSDFADETAESVWEAGGSLDAALWLAETLEGPYIVKDYVKSRKHEWYDACYIQNIADKKNAKRVIGNFIDRQGGSLMGGIVLRKFEKLRQIGFHDKSGMPLSEEYRVFIYAGRVIKIDDYWRKNEEVGITDGERLWIESIAGRIKSNFVTLDLARKEDGSLIVMELGDGQVSGIQQIKPVDFYEAF